MPASLGQAQTRTPRAPVLAATLARRRVSWRGGEEKFCYEEPPPRLPKRGSASRDADARSTPSGAGLQKAGRAENDSRRHFLTQ